MPLDAERWERIQALFHQAVALAEPERRTFLDTLETEDRELAREVAALLEHDSTSGSVLERDVAEVAGRLLERSIALPGVIGPYRIVRVLGEGGMGVVYLAERVDLQNQVAVKVLRDATLSPARRERFQREEHTLAQLNHPSIARLYDAGVLPDGTPYFAMEYVDGLPLTEYCSARGCSIIERIRIFRDVCRAVQHAHRHAVVHRDLKPSNILVSDSGPEARASVKLLDFGIAKQLENLDTPTDRTQTVLRMMTPAYAAPEQLRGEAVGVYTDVYALGVILYELLTDRHPFRGDELSPSQVEARVLESGPERPSALVRRLTQLPPSSRLDAAAMGRTTWGDLDVLCLTAMHADPQRRYSTVEGLLRDLDHFLNNEPLEARPDTIGYRVGKFLRRNRTPVAAAAVATSVLVGTVAFYTAQLRDQRHRAEGLAAKAEEVSSFLVGLFDAGDPFAAEGDTLTVRMLLERGTERAERLDAQPDVKSQMLDVLGRVYMWIGDYERSEELLRRALSLRTTTGEAAEIATSTGNLGRLFSFTGDRDSSETYLREALALRRSHLPGPDASLAVILHDLGSLLVEKGEFDEAEGILHDALEIQREVYDEPHTDLANTLNTIGTSYFNRGRHRDAEPYYREALQIDQSVYGLDHPTVATRMANLALVVSAGDPASADALLNEALAVMERRLGENHYLTAYYRLQHGSILRRGGELGRAEVAVRQAVAAHEQHFGAGHPNTITSLNQLGLLLGDLGRYAEAEPLFRRSVLGFREVVGDQHYYTAASLCQLGHALHQLGRVEEAEGYFREGLPILASVMPEGHASVLLNQSRFGGLLVTLAKYDEAEDVLLRVHGTLVEMPSAGPEHAFTREAAGYLAALYSARGLPERAEAYRAGSLAAADLDE